MVLAEKEPKIFMDTRVGGQIYEIIGPRVGGCKKKTVRIEIAGDLRRIVCGEERR